MERLSQLEPRTSVLEDDFDEEALEQEGKAAEAAAVPALRMSCLRPLCSFTCCQNGKLCVCMPATGTSQPGHCVQSFQ